MKSRIMYIENKSAGGLGGAGRIGRVTFSQTGRTVYYKGKEFAKTKSGYKYNHFDVATNENYWISGPRKDGNDRLYGGQDGVEIDEDVWEEYWRDIRGVEKVPTYRSPL